MGCISEMLLVFSAETLRASIINDQCAFTDCIHTHESGRCSWCWDLIHCTVKLLQLSQRDFRSGQLSTTRQFLGIVQESACTSHHFQVVCCMQPHACRVREFNNVIVVQDVPVVYSSQDCSGMFKLLV